MSELGMFSMGGNKQNAFQQHQQNEDVEMSGGRRRRRRSRTRKGGRGRRGRGGYLTDVAVAAGLLGATQLAKGRYGYSGPRRYGYGSSTRRRSSRRSRN
jgi:hypothetical protein